MEVIGNKSKQACISALIGGFIGAAFGAGFLYVLFNFVVPQFGTFAYIVAIVPAIIVIACISSIIKGFIIMGLPSDLVSADDFQVKLARPEIAIQIADIEAVIGENTIHTHTSDHGYTSTTVERYGNIVIRTKSGQRYVQKYVARVQEVAQILNNRIIKKNP